MVTHHLGASKLVKMTQASRTSKRIAPGAYDALVEALSVIFWNKNPFERFLRVSLRDHPELLSGLTFGGLKRQVASDLVMELAAKEDRYQAVTLALMIEVTSMEEFPNLQSQADKTELLATARRAVASLRKWTAQYGELAEAHEKLQSEQVEEEHRYEAQRSVERVLAEQKQAFLTLHEESDAQVRGRLFEPL